MKALVIGGTRFVGPLLVHRLLARGDEVTLFNRGTLADPFGERVRRIVGDRRTDLERARGRWDAVFDLAAYDRADVERAIATFHGDVGRYLLVSTGSVYLVRAGLEAPFRESDYVGATIARAPGEDGGWDYGMGKRDAEDLLVATPSFPATRLRIPCVHGPRDYQRRLESIFHRVLDRGPILCPEPSRRLRHVDAAEVARTMVALVDEPRAAGEVYNQCHDETPTNAELVAAIAREIGGTARLVAVSDDAMTAAGIDPRAAYPLAGAMSLLDPAKIRALGIGHASFEIMIAKAVAELLAHLPTPPAEYTAQRAKEIALAASAGTLPG